MITEYKVDSKKTYDILLIKKIPYLTNSLGLIFCIALFTFIFLYSGILSGNSTPEIKAFYLIETSSVKLLYGSAITAAITLLLYIWATQKKKGLIIFKPGAFELILKNERRVLLFTDIRCVYCNDAEDRHGNANKKFTLTVDTWKNKKILIRIKNIADIQAFTDKLLACQSLKITYLPALTLD